MLIMLRPPKLTPDCGRFDRVWPLRTLPHWHSPSHGAARCPWCKNRWIAAGFAGRGSATSGSTLSGVRHCLRLQYRPRAGGPTRYQHLMRPPVVRRGKHLVQLYRSLVFRQKHRLAFPEPILHHTVRIRPTQRRRVPIGHRRFRELHRVSD